MLTLGAHAGQSVERVIEIGDGAPVKDAARDGGVAAQPGDQRGRANQQERADARVEEVLPPPLAQPRVKGVRPGNLARTSFTYICRIFETANSFFRPSGPLPRLIDCCRSPILIQWIGKVYVNEVSTRFPTWLMMRRWREGLPGESWRPRAKGWWHYARRDESRDFHSDGVLCSRGGDGANTLAEKRPEVMCMSRITPGKRRGNDDKAPGQCPPEIALARRGESQDPHSVACGLCSDLPLFIHPFCSHVLPWRSMGQLSRNAC